MASDDGNHQSKTDTSRGSFTAIHCTPPPSHRLHCRTICSVMYKKRRTRKPMIGQLVWGRRGTNHWALKTGKQVRGRRPLKTDRSNLHAFNAQNVAGAADIRPMALCIIVGAESKPPSHPVCVWTGIHNCLTIGGGSWFSSGVSLCLSIYFVKGVSLQGCVRFVPRLYEFAFVPRSILEGQSRISTRLVWGQIKSQ